MIIMLSEKKPTSNISYTIKHLLVYCSINIHLIILLALQKVKQIILMYD